LPPPRFAGGERHAGSVNSKLDALFKLNWYYLLKPLCKIRFSLAFQKSQAAFERENKSSFENEI